MWLGPFGKINITRVNKTVGAWYNNIFEFGFVVRMKETF